MVFFRPRRDRRGPDRFLSLRMVLLAAGGIIAFAGIAFDIGWLINAAIIVLVTGLALSLRRSGEAGPESAEDGPAD